MRLRLKITGVFLIFALLTSCVAATENKDLPTKEEITDFIAGIPVSDNYINTVYNTVIDRQPAWNCDTWVDKNGNQILSLYYVDPYSAKGYGSMYFNEFGKKISMPGVGFKLENKYVGKAVSEGATPVDTTSVEPTPVDTTSVEPTPVDTTSVEPTPVDTTTGLTEEQSPEGKAQSFEDERLAEYEERLAEYEERLNEYEDDQSVKYKDQPVNYYPPSIEDESKSVDEMAQTVKDTAQVVENVTQTVEIVATRVEEEEEAKWYKEISNEIFAGVVVTFICAVGSLIIKLILKPKITSQNLGLLRKRF